MEATIPGRVPGEMFSPNTKEIPAYAKNLLAISTVVGIIAVSWQLRIWYEDDFKAISWLVLCGTFLSSCINAIYQYHVYSITGNAMGFVSVVISLTMTIVVMTLKYRRQQERSKEQ